MKQPSQNYIKKCAFCETGSDLTEEHVWWQWLKPYLAHDRNKFTLRHLVFGKKSNTAQGRIRAGKPLGSQVPIACQACNSGWLSQIQQTAKRHLTPLIEGKPTVLDAKAQTTVATWATMATMTGEYIHRKQTSIAVTQAERTAFMNINQPLPDWRIWIGHYHPVGIFGSWIHAAAAISNTENGSDIQMGEDNVPTPNTQWSTMFVGRLYIHVASSSAAPDYIRDWNWRTTPRARRLLVQVWPVRDKIIAWPILPLTSVDARRFATAHFDWLHRIGKGT